MLLFPLILLIPTLCTAEYPISGSWFRDFSNATEAETTLKQFKKIGGDTVFLRGAQFQNRTMADIKQDPLFSSCQVDRVHCVDRAKSSLLKKGLVIQQWLTYSYEDDYTDKLIQCPGFDERVTVGRKTYMVLTLWTEQYKASGDCTFTNGSKVAVFLTSYSGRGDPHQMLLNVAKDMEISVYLGLARTPYIDESQEAADIMQAYYGFVYRVIQDHQSRYQNNSAMKGYYSSEEVIPAYILDEDPENRKRVNTSLPARYVVMYLRELMFLAGSANYVVLASPMLDLTHAGNTTIKNHTDGMAALYLLAGQQFLLRDGRGEGRAAYYTPDEADQPILKVDRSLWEILHQRNSSVTEKTTFNDIYYAPIQKFFNAYGNTGLWLMIEAYDDFKNGSWCKPLDPKGSGVNTEVQRVHKERIDKALSSVSMYVNKITAFAWDPMFTCQENGGMSLVDEIIENVDQPIISECRFHSQSNQSVVLIGYNFDALMQKFNVSYTRYDDRAESVLLSGYYFEMDYGEQHHLVKGLEYTQLYDIPNLRDLKRVGTITVTIPNTKQLCSFHYQLNQLKNANLDDVIG